MDEIKEQRTFPNDRSTLIQLTKREYFAAMILQGAITYTGVHTGDGFLGYSVKMALKWADELIKQLEEE